jgi:CsoR family transcriptional regulator, copper-sensing transcriptional repressor
MTNKNEKQKISISLKKARSLTDKLIEMLESGEYCIDIMQQNLAAIGLLRSAHQMLLERHLNSCFKNAMAAGSEKIQNRMIAEILKVSKLANK